MYDHVGIALIIVAKKVPGHCCIVIVFDVINMTVESINDSISCLFYIFNMATLAFQAIYQIVALAGASGNGIVGCVVVEVSYSPWLG